MKNQETMTQDEFDSYYKHVILEAIAQEYEQDGIPDRPARREAYNNTVDYLTKIGQVSEQDANEWCISDSLETTKYWL